MKITLENKWMQKSFAAMIETEGKTFGEIMEEIFDLDASGDEVFLMLGTIIYEILGEDSFIIIQFGKLYNEDPKLPPLNTKEITLESLDAFPVDTIHCKRKWKKVSGKQVIASDLNPKEKLYTLCLIQHKLRQSSYPGTGSFQEKESKN